MTSADNGNTAGASGPGGDPAREGFTVTDKRVIDPETGEARPQEAQPASAQAQSDAQSQAQNESAQTAAGLDESEVAAATDDTRVLELTKDLQRVTAEYANYRKRVERDRGLATEMTTASVLNTFLPVLDDLSLAEKNGDLDGTFKTVASSIRTNVTKLGLEQYGEIGDSFDPEIHEALAHRERVETDGDAEGQICVEIYQPGYRFKERVVRPARVVVAE